ncbi:SHOCT domain-containing protein [Streptomyces sp. KL118A]|uniref:SHOCT domain-containing protein n=1 Tax=Streptomyces sp. KL118A TaxID=3045153 RepID=UPI00278C074C|nr:SHOCT domain-containing protein [Streptomyces sp. KL118A]
MYWHNDHDMGGRGDWAGWDVWGWFAASVGSLLFWALIITAVVLLVRAFSRTPRATAAPPRLAAEQLLAERFARGEIDEDEYHRRLGVLRAGDGTRLTKS